MKIENINLENIKVVAFDFDDTLAIHKDKDFCNHRRESEDKYLSYYLNAYQNPDTFYEDIEPCIKSEVLYNFINKHYGRDIEIISTASQELKYDAIKIIKKLNNCRLEEILFIDDRQDVVEFLSQNKINSILVNEIES